MDDPSKTKETARGGPGQHRRGESRYPRGGGPDAPPQHAGNYKGLKAQNFGLSQAMPESNVNNGPILGQRGVNANSP